MQVAGRTVAGAYVEGAMHLTLLFDDGQTLVCRRDPPDHDSYSIDRAGQMIIVEV